MSDAARDIFAEWTLPPWLTLSIVLAAAVYARGWSKIRKTRPAQFTVFRLTSFFAGLAVLWLSIGSPMDGFADALLSAHMVEHLLLMSAVPPLLLMGWPVVPMLRGLPRFLVRGVAGPLLRWRGLRRFGHWMVKPAVAWIAMNAAFLAWHVPRAYDYALEHEGWHVVEHICFLGTSILFWWCIVQPWPTGSGTPGSGTTGTGTAGRHRLGWGILIYLVSADVVNTLLSAFLAFCGRPVYLYYLQHPGGFHVSPVEDQVLGAVIMWVIGSFAFLVPAMLITADLLRPAQLTGSRRLQ